MYVSVYMIHNMNLLDKIHAGNSELRTFRNLEKILDFVELTRLFRGVERDIFLMQEKRLENDTEHSYQLAIVSWYIAEIQGLNLNISKVIKYALVHDLVEVYAGDTPLYTATETYVQSKTDREKQALRKIEQKFPEFKELHTAIHAYEERDDPESRFVYTVDKLLPILSIYLEKGNAWKDKGISIEMIINKNASRISIVPEIKSYFDVMIRLMRGSPEYFTRTI